MWYFCDSLSYIDPQTIDWGHCLIFIYINRWYEKVDTTILLKSDLRSDQSFATQRSNETHIQSREPIANQKTAYAAG